MDLKVIYHKLTKVRLLSRDQMVTSDLRYMVGPITERLDKLADNRQYLWDYVATEWCHNKTEFDRYASTIKKRFYRRSGDDIVQLIDILYDKPLPDNRKRFYDTLEELHKRLSACAHDGPFIYGDLHSHLFKLERLAVRDVATIHFNDEEGTVFDAWRELRSIFAQIGYPFDEPYGIEFCADNVQRLSALHETSIASLDDPDRVADNATSTL